MRPSELYAEGARAADEIIASVFRVGVEKALNPLNPRDYLVISRRLAQAIAGVTRDAEAQVMRDALDQLDVEWDKLTDKQHDRIIDATRIALARGPVEAIPAVRRVLEMTGQSIIEGTKKKTRDAYAMEIGVVATDVDKRIVEHAAKSQSLFITSEYDRRASRFSEKARAVVSEGLEEGASNKAIAVALRADVGQYVARSDAYWNTIANVFAGRARAYAALSSYEEAGIERYKFMAVLDERTTLQCRFMHGRSFEVGSALQRYGDVEGSGDPESVRVLQPWIATGRDDGGGEFLYYKNANGQRIRVADVQANAVGRVDDVGAFKARLSDAQLQDRGIMTPPCHARCRSTIVPDM